MQDNNIKTKTMPTWRWIPTVASVVAFFSVKPPVSREEWDATLRRSADSIKRSDKAIEESQKLFDEIDEYLRISDLSKL